MTAETGLDETTVRAIVRAEYDVAVLGLTELSGGLDRSARTFRLDRDGQPSLVLRVADKAPPDAATLVPRHLGDVGVETVVAPIRAPDGRILVRRHGRSWTLSSYVDGPDGWTHGMGTAEWAALGAALRAVHGVELPPEIVGLLRRDGFDAAAYAAGFADYDSRFENRSTVAASFGAAWSSHRGTVTAMLDQMTLLADLLRTSPRATVLCHGDLHPGNVLVAADGLHIIDWDETLLAPRERDFIFVPGLSPRNSPNSSDAKGEAFLAAYDPTAPVDVDWVALTYYRCERVVQDVLVEAGRALEHVPDDDSGPTTWLDHFFQPGGEAESAIATAQWLPPNLDRLSGAG